MADFRLTQTGEQIQAILNQQPLDHTALDGHIENSVIHVTSQNKTDWNAKYNKPSGGIPKTDLAAAVQQAVELALTAYQKPSGGIPKSDLTSALQTAIDKALSAYQKPDGGIPKTDLAAAVQSALEAAVTAYQKPNTGIPKEDMTQEVQTILATASSQAEQIIAEAQARQQADENLQGQINTKTTQAQVESLIAAAVANFVTGTQVQSAIATALDPYSTTAEVQLAIQNAITAALTNYYTSAVINQMLSEKVNKVSGKQLSTEDFTTALKNKLDALPTSAALATQISTAISTALASYYTKAQTDSLLSQKQTAAQVADAIAAALTSYSTTSQMNAAISTALGSYYTKTEIDTKFERVQFLERGLGKYDNTRSITLQQATAGKYVNVNGQEVSASGYGISAEVQLNAGDIMLVPSASAVPASVSLFARIVTRTYDKVINYAYTYRQDYPELPATATADYNPALIYTAQYNETGDTPVLTGWLMGGQTYTTLPATRTVTESYYEPLMKQAVAAMPSTGYYVYLCQTSMTIVVSGYTATVNGGVALVVGLGIFKNIATNFVGAPGQSVLAQAFAVLFAAIDGLKAQLDNLGETKAVSIDFEEQPKLCGQPLVIEGDGAPAAPVVPTMVGQRYHDNTNRKVYEAFAVTNSVSDWVLIN